MEKKFSLSDMAQIQFLIDSGLENDVEECLRYPCAMHDMTLLQWARQSVDNDLNMLYHPLREYIDLEKYAQDALKAKRIYEIEFCGKTYILEMV